MAYSQGLKTRFIDPVYHDTYRSRFVLPRGSTHMTNLRLQGLGAVLVVGAAAVPVNALLGVLASIRNIFLYCDGKLLDQRREFNRWAGFHLTLQTTNSTSINMNSPLFASRWGFAVDGALGEITVQTPVRDLTNDPLTTTQGDLYLQDALGFLQAVDMMPNAMGVISLELEWDNRPNTVNPVGVVASFLRPQLVVDYSDDPKMAAQAAKQLAKDVRFPSVIHDVAYVGAGTPNPSNTQPIQTVTVRPRGFDGVTLKSLLVTQEPAVANTSVGRLGSLTRWRGVDRFSLNGSALHGFEGIDTPTRRQTLLSATYGIVNTIPGMAETSFPDMANHVSDLSLIGGFDYTGVPIGAVVNQLQHDWQRTNAYNGAEPVQAALLENQPLTLHYFGDTDRVRRANGDINDV